MEPTKNIQFHYFMLARHYFPLICVLARWGLYYIMVNINIKQMEIIINV